ncbi:MAG: hypothetical protein WD423_06900 [Rhodothermales bacterium]
MSTGVQVKGVPMEILREAFYAEQLYFAFCDVFRLKQQQVQLAA